MFGVAQGTKRTYKERMSQPALPTQKTILERLEILADAAKYDASCASSGTSKRNSKGGKGIGSTEGMGICHAYAPDGRCISLLKILLTNHCVFDCHYCINRKSSNVTPRAFHAAGGGRPDAVVLPPQLYRRAVPLLGHRQKLQPHHGAVDRSRAYPAGRARFSRVHPPQDDSLRLIPNWSPAPGFMPTASRSTSNCRPSPG
jgi:hypothetical protein